MAFDAWRSWESNLGRLHRTPLNRLPQVGGPHRLARVRASGRRVERATLLWQKVATKLINE